MLSPGSGFQGPINHVRTRQHSRRTEAHQPLLRRHTHTQSFALILPPSGVRCAAAAAAAPRCCRRHRHRHRHRRRSSPARPGEQRRASRGSRCLASAHAAPVEHTLPPTTLPPRAAAAHRLVADADAKIAVRRVSRLRHDGGARQRQRHLGSDTYLLRQAGRPTPPPPTLPSCAWPAIRATREQLAGPPAPRLRHSSARRDWLCNYAFTLCIHGAKQSEHSSCLARRCAAERAVGRRASDRTAVAS